jgi:4-amino-4-deoxy-L-arabinose transferase-like glycosyltransferase
MTSTTAGAPSLDTKQPARSAPRLDPALAVVLTGVAVRLVLAAAAPMTNDEAYYVDWGRNLQPGYLDHPPAVGWLAAGAIRLLGYHPVAVRLPAILLQGATILLAASLARARAGQRAGTAVALLLQAVPVFSVSAALLTPEAPLALAWVGALFSLERALRRDPRWMLTAGLFLGLGALSKLTAGLLGIALLAALLATADGRELLRGPWPWLGALLALAAASPMLLWNAAHGWPSFAFQASHGMRGRGFSAARLAASIGGQLAYVSPLLLALAAAAAWRALRARRDAVEAALAFSALPVIGFFTAAAAFTPGALPHWPGPGWISASILLAAAGSRWLRAAVWSGLAIAGALVAVLASLAAVQPPLPKAVLEELPLGWRAGAAAARAAAGDARLAATHWIALGRLGWYDRRSPAYLGDRPSGPTYYDPAPLARGEPLLIVTVDGLGPQRGGLEERMGPLEPAGEAEARHGDRVVRRFRFWRWRPAPPSHSAVPLR